MDREDVRFAADALDARLSGQAEELDRLAATCMVRLMGVAQALRRNAGTWPPAICGVLRLEAIARGGAEALNLPADDNEKIIVDKLLALAAELPTPVNRHERRVKAKLHLPRKLRVAGVRSRLTLQ